MNKPAFAPHRIRRNQLQAIKKDIIVTDMVFDERISQGGIILPNDNGTSKGIRPRWGHVYAVGSQQQDVTVGQWVCVAHGRWTRGLDIEDESGKRTIRKIDPNDILLVADEKPMDITFSEAIHIDKKPYEQLHD
jgi:co-chaperonin GroES (HSP10)